MTKFLERALAVLADGCVNRETERLFAYHHATKHTYDSVRTTAHFLDWRNQPDPFRVYHGARMIPLEPKPDFTLAGTFETMAALAQGRIGNSGGKGGGGKTETRLDARWMSRLLWYSMAVSAWKQVPHSSARYSLRVNPSSGNLHPTETHLALRGFAGLEDGLYHYRADLHGLEQRGRGDWVAALATALKLDVATSRQAPLIVALTSVFWREAWKYRDRAYRYCCHDLGHAMMSILLAARALGLAGGVVAHFSDQRLARVLGLEHTDEAPMAFLVFQERREAEDVKDTAETAENVYLPAELMPGIPNELSEEEVPYYLLLGIHGSTVLTEQEAKKSQQIAEAQETKERQEPCAFSASSASSPLFTSFISRDSSPSAPLHDASLGPVTRRRRSALDFDPQTPPMERTTFEQILDLATRDWLADWRANFGREAQKAKEEMEEAQDARDAKDAKASKKTNWQSRDFIELYIYVHRVRDLEPGVYRWSPGTRRLEQLHMSNVQRAAAYLSLEQALAANACFALSMIADLKRASQLYGNRGYRYVHFEAGAIGQRLYLGAEALGWNATGIGAFYDDDVHRYLGFLDEGTPMSELGGAAERGALVQLGMEADEAVAAVAVISESGEERRARPAASRDAGRQEISESTAGAHIGRHLPRQVIYHFAVGRAVQDPRLSAPED